MEYKKIYTAGVCNIGPEETAARNRAGWIGTIVTLVLWAIFIIFKVPHVWRVILFFPAFLGAIGFVQGYFHFCAHFGMSGLFNFGPLGTQNKVTDPQFRALDRKASWKIIIYSALIAAFVAGVGLSLYK
jgi:hypothetical protein